MSGVVRQQDVFIGFGTHGAQECPHTIVGFYTGGLPSVRVNGLPVIRNGDFGVHNCPHCGMSMSMQGYPLVLAGGQMVSLQNQAVTHFCGIGQNVGCSVNVRAGEQG